MIAGLRKGSDFDTFTWCNFRQNLFLDIQNKVASSSHRCMSLSKRSRYLNLLTQQDGRLLALKNF